MRWVQTCKDGLSKVLDELPRVTVFKANNIFTLKDPNNQLEQVNQGNYGSHILGPSDRKTSKDIP